MRTFWPAMLALLLLAGVLRIDLYFAIVYFLLAIYLLSRLWLRQVYRQLHVARRFTDRVFCGEQVTVDLVIRNGSRLPIPWLEIAESTPRELTVDEVADRVISLGPRDRTGIQYTLAARRRGYYRIGPLSVEAGDILDIERKRGQWVEDRPLVVYPRVVPLGRVTLPSNSALVSLPARSPLFEDPSRIVGVRAYQRGDSPRRIHWTATARAGELLVKQYEPAIARETLVCLDLDSAVYERRSVTEGIEMAVVVVASLANRIIVSEGLPAGVLTHAHDPLTSEETTFLLPARRERRHLVTILELLARVQPTTDTPMGNLLRRHRLELPWGTTIVVVTGGIDDALAETALLLRRNGVPVSAILIRPPGPGAESHAARWAATGAPLRRVWTDRELVAWA
jgi:uncharacterized protein (DUF58 family)